jgi:Zn-finger nucleic acid-binding protein
MSAPESYRATPATCPVCTVPMEMRPAGDAIVDVCPTCRGLWLDWFDGDTLAVTELALPLSRRPTPAAAGDPKCPRCTQPLAQREHDAGGPAVWRCGECAGTFLPRDTVDALLIWAASHAYPPLPADAPPESVRQASLIQRLRHALKALFGGAA